MPPLLAIHARPPPPSPATGNCSVTFHVYQPTTHSHQTLLFRVEGGMSLVCSAPLLGCVSCLLCSSMGPGTHCHAMAGPGRGGSSVSLTAQIRALQPLLCHQFILKFSMSFNFTTGVLLSPAVHSEPCGPWLCREPGTWHADTTHILSLLKSRVQMPSPYPAEGWRGLFCLTPEWEC